MRILDEDTDSKLDHVTLYLTLDEARELLGALEDLLRAPYANHHHLSTDDYTKELTLCLYGPDLMAPFNERSKRLIEEDR